MVAPVTAQPQRATDEADVRQADDGFYGALDHIFQGDVWPMVQVWSHSPDVTLLDPFGGWFAGWDHVRGQFEGVSRAITGGHVHPEQRVIHLGGDLAYTACYERGTTTGPDGKAIPVNHRATNIYRREDGQWKLVHHHTDAAAALQSGLHLEQ